jgi:L-alanine-DL-glutamate epimerase-like enolase superfamily enzyme
VIEEVRNESGVFLQAPSKPGLGLEVNEETAQRYLITS